MPLLAPRSSGADGISPDGKITGQDNIEIPDQQPNSTDANQVDTGQEQEQNVDTDTFSFDAFKAAKTLEIPDPLKKEEKIEEEDVEPEIKEEEEKAKPEVQKAIESQEDLDKPQPQVKVKKSELPDKRDYSGIDPSLVPHFKRMGNDAFAAIKPLIIAQQEEIKKRDEEIKGLKVGKIPDSYYEHERAYMLTPEFESAATAVNEAEVVYRHWEQQLNSVREGAKTFKTIVRNQQGQLVYGQDVPADASAETKLMSLFNGAHNQLMTYNGKLAAISENYKGNYSTGKQWVDNINNTGFSKDFNDPKSRLSVAAQEYINKTMPAVFRNNPLSATVARSIITMAEMYKLLVQADKALKEKAAGSKQVQTKVPKAKQQPTNNDISNDGGSNNNRAGEVTFDDFKAVKGM